MRSAFAPVLLPLAALIASLVRWWLQGSGNLYTALDKRFFIPDPDLGWRVASQHPIWLGLEVCAIIAAIAVGLAVGGYVIGRLEARGGRRLSVLRVATWIVAALPLAVPIAAFASGPGVAGGRDTLPPRATGVVETGIAGALDAPAGRYDVVAHEGTAITARMSAGGETFEARFASGVEGSWVGDPRDLTRPMTADLRVATASIDTGISGRTTSARDSYLRATEFPHVTFTLGTLVAARSESPATIAFRARGTVGLLGKTHAVEITGTLAKPDAAALARLGLSGAELGAHLIVQADFSLAISETALAPDAGDFDTDELPIHVSLVVRHTRD